MIELRPYQTEGLAALEKAVSAGCATPLLAWATGLGKTVLFAAWRARRPGRCLVIAHREELLAQAAEKLAIAGATRVGTVKAERDDFASETIVASIQTLSRPGRLERVLDADPFTTVIVDEAHHSEAPSYRNAIRALRAFCDCPVLGVTATPARGDRKALGRTWERIVHSVSILDGIRLGYLVDLRMKRVRLDANFSELRKRGGDIAEAQAERMMLDAKAPAEVANAIHAYAMDRQTLVFTAGVQLAHETARACARLGFEAAAVDGTTPDAERHAILRRFRSGELQVVANCNVLTEGYDEPSIACIVMARPTCSQPFYAQMIGRGTRVAPGKQDCLILDVVGNTMRHDLVTLPALFAGQVREVAMERGESIIGALAPPPGGEVYATTVPFRRRFAWVRTKVGWVLGLGDRRDLLLAEAPVGYEVHLRTRTETHCLYRGASLEWATGIAEEEVRRVGAQSLADVNAKWRSARASLAQREALYKFGVSIGEACTKGEAADLLTAAIAGRVRR